MTTSEALETKLRKKIRKSKIQKLILGSLYAAGALSIAVLAPNVLGALARLSPGKRKKYRKYAVDNALGRLREKGMIQWEENGKGTVVRLTPQGEQVLDAFEKREFSVRTPQKWDERWRIIIFDIAEKRRRVRDKFRTTLIQMGFLKLQDSVWIYPYDCEELIALIKADFKIGKDILYVIADFIENDRWIKRYFGL